MTDQGLSIFDEEPDADATTGADEDSTQVMPTVSADKPEPAAAPGGMPGGMPDMGGMGDF